jgi:hypothetical protein
MPDGAGTWTDIEITDDYMTAMRAKTKSYTVLLLRRTPGLAAPDAWPTVWEHGRRNHQLRAHGVLPIVCPMPGDPELAGIGIFDAEPAEVDRIMADDPAVKAGLLTYSLHPCRGFPGDALSG